MKVKIFINEFLGNKKNIFMFLIITSILLTVIGVQTIIINDTKENSLTPDVIFTGDQDEGKYTYKLYNAINGVNEEVVKLDENKSIDVIDQITRNIISLEQATSINSVMYTLDGLDTNFIDSKLKNYLSEGTLPKKDQNEVLVGYYAAQAFKLGVGDTIGDKEFEIEDNPIVIPTTLEEDINIDLELKSYKVVGILNENAEYFKSSFILPYDFNNGIKANKVLLYFNDNNSMDVYKNFIDKSKSSKETIKFGSVSENFYSKQSTSKQLIINIAIIVLISLVIIYLIISYLIKGINKKIGILKALGIKDSTIIKIFVGGLGLIELVSFFISLIMIFIINNVMNKRISDFLGFEVKRYAISLQVILVQSVVAIIIFLAVFLIIKYKTTRVSPKECIVKS